MKLRKLTPLLALFLIFSFLGCGASENAADLTSAVSDDLVLDSSYVIVVPKTAGDSAYQAARCLQITMDTKMRLPLPDIVNTDPGEYALVLDVDEALAEGQYQYAIRGTSLYIKAQTPSILLYATKHLRQALLDSGDPNTVTATLCQSLSGTVDTKNLPFTFITQNILFKNIEGGNTVDERAPRFQSLVLEYQPDILAIQENSSEWISHYEKLLGGTYFAINQESRTILLRTDRYELVEKGYFWMSPTPDRKSQFEGDSGPRSCCWAVVKDLITDRTLFICNAHLDWNNDTQRALQLEVLIEQMSPYFDKYPSILCGDFNSGPDGPIYARACEVLTDSRVSAGRNISEVNFTCHSFGEKLSFFDYIFHSSDFQADLYYIVSDRYGGYVSDHYGVLTEFAFAE